MAVVVGPSRLRDDAAETGFDWSPVAWEDCAERDPLTGVALTEEQELYGDPWTELMATMSPEELGDWLGNQTGSSKGLCRLCGDHRRG